jgi:hypothetical protein
VTRGARPERRDVLSGDGDLPMGAAWAGATGARRPKPRRVSARRAAGQRRRRG